MTALSWLLLVLAMVPVIWLWVYAIGDLVRRDDISTRGRSMWIVGVIVLPLLGALLYLVYRPARSEDIRGFGRRRGGRHNRDSEPQ